MSWSTLKFLYILAQDKSSWLGGYKNEQGVEVKVIDTLHEIFDPHYELVESFDMPVMTMEEPRLWFLCVDNVTVWRRKQDYNLF